MKRFAVVVVVAAVLAVALAGAAGTIAAEKAAPPPKPVVLHFKNIPAESFMRTLKQLGSHERVGEALRQIPMALNEEGNSVVVIGPPEVVEFLSAIAKGLDVPNEFRLQQREFERQEMELRMKMAEARQKLGLPPGPPPGMKPGQMGPMPGMKPGQMGPMPGMKPGQMGPMPGMKPGEKGPMPGMKPGQKGPMPGPMGGPMMQGMKGGPMMQGVQGGMMCPMCPMCPMGRMGRMGQEGGPPEGRGPMMQGMKSGPPEGRGPMMQGMKSGPPEGRGPMMMGRPGMPPAMRGEGDEGRGRDNVKRDVPPAEKGDREGKPKTQRDEAAPRERREAEERERAPKDEKPHRPALGPAAPVPATPVADLQPARFRLIQGEVRIEVAPGGEGRGRGGPGGEGRGAGGEGRAGGRGQGGRGDPAQREQMIARFQMQALYNLLADADARSEIGLTIDQEARIAAIQDKMKKTRERIETDARMQFGRSDGPGEGGEEGGGGALQSAAGRAAGQGLRDAQPQFDALMSEAIAVLTEEQKAKLLQVGQERQRLAAVSGGLWVLLTKRAKEELGLTDDVVARIRKILTEAADRADEKRKETMASMQDLSQEQRGEVMRERIQALMKDREETRQKTRDAVFAILTAEQQPKAEKMVAEAETKGFGAFGGFRMMGSGGASGGMMPGGPPAGGGRPGGPGARPILQEESPARFWLVAEDAGGPPPAAGGQGPPTDAERARWGDMARRAMTMRWLDDPDAREELRITPEQERKIFDLKDRAQGLFNAVRQDLEARFKERQRPDMTDEERQDLRREMGQAIGDAMRSARAEFETMMGEAEALLTDEQKAKLQDVGRQRAKTETATMGLAYLTTQRARDEFAFTYDQVARIRTIVREVEADVQRLSDEIFGPGKEPTPEDLRGEKGGPFREQQKTIVKKALERIMTFLTGDQREKVQKWADTRMNRPAGPQGLMGRRGQRLGAPTPGSPAPGPENPAPKAQEQPI